MTVVAAGLGVAAACIAAVPAYRQGWVRLVPTVVLAVAAPAEDPVAPEAASSIALQLTSEMWRRLTSKDAIWEWESSLFIGRYFRHYPEDIGEICELPERWPTGFEIPVRHGPTSDVSFWQHALQLGLRAAGKEATVIPWDGQASIAPCDRAADGVGFVATLMSGRHVRYAAKVIRPIVIRPGVDGFLERLSDEGTNSQVAIALSPILHWARFGAPWAGVGISRVREEWVALPCLVAAQVELRVDDRVVATGSIALDRDWRWGFAERYQIPLRWVRGGRAAADRGLDKLRLLFRGDPAEAGRVYMESPFARSAVCWTGEVEVPVAVDRKAGDP